MEYVLTLRLDSPVSPSVLAQELALHVAPLIARQMICGDVVVGKGIEGEWSLEQESS